MSRASGSSATADGAARPRRPEIPRATAFWIAGGVLFVFLFAAGAPAPLYGVYQAELRFSPTTLTVIFAVYALALLVTLLVAGTLSDYVGRRPVIIAALIVNIAAAALFLAASSVAVLLAARIVQGIAVGAATGALGAALIELQPAGGNLAPVVNSAAPGFGLAAGAFGTSALIQYGPAPTRLIWWLLLGCYVVAVAGVALMPETVTRRPGVLASMRPRIRVPRPARRTFAAALPCLIAVWALGGLYLSLGPLLAAQVLGSGDLVWGGLVVFLLTGVGGAATLLFRGLDPPRAMLAGCLILLAGSSLTLAAILTSASAPFLAGTGLAGIGFGLAFLGAFRTLSALAEPGDRAALIAVIYLVSYLAFSVPALAAGIAVTHEGLRSTALAYCAAVAALVALAAGGLILARRGTTGPAPRSAQINPPPAPCTVPPSTCHARPDLS